MPGVQLHSERPGAPVSRPDFRRARSKRASTMPAPVMAQRCEVWVRFDLEKDACGKPAVWFIEHVRGDGEYWACEQHASEALRYMGGECSDASGEPAHIDPATGDLVAVEA